MAGIPFLSKILALAGVGLKDQANDKELILALSQDQASSSTITVDLPSASGKIALVEETIPLSQKGSALGVATLDNAGKIPSEQLPPLSAAQVYVVQTIAERDALTAAEGDVCVVTDVSTSYIYDGAAWQEFLSPGAAVTSVNGQIGSVFLTASDVGAVASTEKGAANGVAPLDSSGLVPSEHLPPAPVQSVNGQTNTVVLSASDVGAIASIEKGSPNGVASLDASGYLPAAQLSDWIDKPLGINSTGYYGAELRLREGNGQEGDYIALRAAQAIPQSFTLTLPSADGQDGQALVTNGAGVLSWANAGGGGQAFALKTENFLMAPSDSGTLFAVNSLSDNITATLDGNTWQPGDSLTVVNTNQYGGYNVFIGVPYYINKSSPQDLTLAWGERAEIVFHDQNSCTIDIIKSPTRVNGQTGDVTISAASIGAAYTAGSSSQDFEAQKLSALRLSLRSDNIVTKSENFDLSGNDDGLTFKVDPAIQSGITAAFSFGAYPSFSQGMKFYFINPSNQELAIQVNYPLQSNYPDGYALLPGCTAEVTFIQNDSVFVKIHKPISYPVASVNGQTGAVSLNAGDVGAIPAYLLDQDSGVATLDNQGRVKAHTGLIVEGNESAVWIYPGQGPEVYGSYYVGRSMGVMQGRYLPYQVQLDHSQVTYGKGWQYKLTNNCGIDPNEPQPVPSVSFACMADSEGHDARILHRGGFVTELLIPAGATTKVTYIGLQSVFNSPGVYAHTWIAEEEGLSSAPVSSVNGQTGAVALDTDDVLEGSNQYFTDARAKAAAVVNSAAGSETDQAPSVSAMKGYVDTADGALSARIDKLEASRGVYTGTLASNQTLSIASLVPSGAAEYPLVQIYEVTGSNALHQVNVEFTFDPDTKSITFGNVQGGSISAVIHVLALTSPYTTL